MRRYFSILMLLAFLVQSVLPVTAACSGDCCLLKSASSSPAEDMASCCASRPEITSVAKPACCDQNQTDSLPIPADCHSNETQSFSLAAELRCFSCVHCQPLPANAEPYALRANDKSWLDQLDLFGMTFLEFLCPAVLVSQQGMPFWEAADNGNRYYGRVLLNLADCVWRK